MCLGVPGEIVEVPADLGGDIAVVRVRDALKRVNVGMLTAPATPGCWVVVHMGFGMETITAEEAHEIMGKLSMDL
jgi:hydrogenase expression/formation protein HypC